MDYYSMSAEALLEGLKKATAAELTRRGELALRLFDSPAFRSLSRSSRKRVVMVLEAATAN